MKLKAFESKNIQLCINVTSFNDCALCMMTTELFVTLNNIVYVVKLGIFVGAQLNSHYGL